MKPAVPSELWDAVRRYGHNHSKASIILEGGESDALGHSIDDCPERKQEARGERALAAVAVLLDSLPNDHALKLTHETRAALADLQPYCFRGTPAAIALERVIDFLDAVLPPPELPPPASIGPTIGGR